MVLFGKYSWICTRLIYRSLLPGLVILFGCSAPRFVANRPQWSRTVASSDLPPALSEPELLAALARADQAWIPEAIPLPGGGTRYIYRRRQGEAPLSLEALRALIRNPPRFEREQLLIRALLSQLQSAGVRVVLAHPRRQGAAGEWEPRRSLLRLRPDLTAKGSREFLRVLNHEAIHVAQSCLPGRRWRRRSELLGLSRSVSPRARQQLQAPLYARVSAHERQLEEEAYANQDQLALGSQLLADHCR